MVALALSAFSILAVSAGGTHHGDGSKQSHHRASASSQHHHAGGSTHHHEHHHPAKAADAKVATELNATVQEPEPFIVATNWVDATVHSLAELDKAVMKPSAILFIAKTNCTRCDQVRPLFAKVAERHYDKSVRFFLVDAVDHTIGEAFKVGGLRWGELNDTEVHPLPAIKYFSGGRDEPQTATMQRSWDLTNETEAEAVQNIETFVHTSHERAEKLLADEAARKEGEKTSALLTENAKTNGKGQGSSMASVLRAVPS